MGDKIKVIMDCDPGIDDGIALAYAAAHQDELELLAVTTSAGSTRIERVTKNALELLDFYGLKVPVAGGQDRPLVKAAIYAGEFHGETGLWTLRTAGSKTEAASDNAVLFIRDILNALPEGEQVVMIETAPMTNLALLLKVFPEIKNKIRKNCIYRRCSKRRKHHTGSRIQHLRRSGGGKDRIRFRNPTDHVRTGCYTEM